MDVVSLLNRVKRLRIATRLAVEQPTVGLFRTAMRGQGIDFEQVRPYQPGDDVRRIDWNVSARHGQTYIKEYREERELNMLLMVDQSASGLFGTPQQQKRDIIHEIVTILAYAAQEHQHRVGLLAFTDQVEQYLKPARGRHQLMQLLERLLQPPGSTQTKLSVAAEAVLRLHPRRTLLVLISDLLDTNYASTLLQLHHRHELVIIRPYHPSEEPHALQGILPLQDLESRRTAWRVHWLGGRSSARASAYQQRVGEAQAFCKKYGVPLLSVGVSVPYYRQLEAFLTRKARPSL